MTVSILIVLLGLVIAAAITCACLAVEWVAEAIIHHRRLAGGRF